MKRFTENVVRRTIPDYEDVQNQIVRSRYGALEGWASTGVNFVLFIAKAVFGFMTGSVSLIADAFHTLSDISTSIVILVSFRLAKKPSDEMHPFGHGRMEAVASVLVAVLLLVAAVEVGKSGVEHLIHPRPFHASWLVVGVIATTVIIKELLARFSQELGRMIDSPALEADFWHHRTDAISSLLVIAAFIGQRLGIAFLDGAAGIVVALMVGYTGFKIAHKGIDDLLGGRPSRSLIDGVKSTALAFDEVLDVHDLIIHQYGQTMVLSFHIEVSETLSLKYAHTIAEEVERAVNEKFKTYTTVHLDPVNDKDPELQTIRERLKLLINSCDGHCSFHDLRTVGEAEAKNILFDLTVDPRMKEKDIDGLKKMLRAGLKESFPHLKGVVIEVEPMYAV